MKKVIEVVLLSLITGLLSMMVYYFFHSHDDIEQGVKELQKGMKQVGEIHGLLFDKDVQVIEFKK